MSTFSDWMANLPSALTTQPLNHIAIPGSHNSASCTLADEQLAKDCPTVLASLQQVFDIRPFLKPWSVCQSLSLRHQLMVGIRYFDLRLEESEGELRFAHGLLGDPLEKGLQDCLAFLKEHPKEVLLLDFNHVETLTEQNLEKLYKQITSVFGGLLCPPDQIPSLQSLWENKRQVIAFVHTENRGKPPSPLWPGEAIPSIWPRTSQADQIVPFLTGQLTNPCPQLKESWHVCQGVISPDPMFIVSKLASSLKDEAASATQNFVDFLHSDSPANRNVNVAVVDFVQSSCFIDAVLKLNESRV